MVGRAHVRGHPRDHSATASSRCARTTTPDGVSRLPTYGSRRGRPAGKKTVFVTNNSTKSRPEYLVKLAGKGIPSDVEDIFGSAYSAAIYISRILKPPAAAEQGVRAGRGRYRERAAHGARRVHRRHRPGLPARHDARRLAGHRRRLATHSTPTWAWCWRAWTSTSTT